jgi:hypothetical protein
MAEVDSVCTKNSRLLLVAVKRKRRGGGAEQSVDRAPQIASRNTSALFLAVLGSNAIISGSAIQRSIKIEVGENK